VNSVFYRDPFDQGEAHPDGTTSGPRFGKPQVSGYNAAGAWKLERGRPDAVVAILDTGVRWDQLGLRLQVHLNQGELPYPEVSGPALETGVNCSSYRAGTYDANGDVTAMADATGTTSYTYDALGRQTSKTLPSGANVPCPVGAGGANVNVSACYTYDNAGSMLTKKDSAGTITYGYNNDGSMASVTNRSGAKTTFGYDSNGNPTTTSYPNGVTETTGYNSSDQLTSIGGAKGSTTFTSYSYSYQNPNTQAQTAIPYSVTDMAGNTTSYTYDGVNQLTNATQKNRGGSQIARYSYGFDPLGQLRPEPGTGQSTPPTPLPGTGLPGLGAGGDSVAPRPPPPVLRVRTRAPLGARSPCH